MSLIGHAIALAADVHKDQVDKGDEPYVYHVLEVAKRAKERYAALTPAYDEQYEKWVICAAILHDVIEDTEDPLARRAVRDHIYAIFPSAVYSAVDALTKYDDEPYDEYIERVAHDWIARIVKLCDLSHNLEAWRIPSGKITERDYKRWDKYHRAFVRLMRED